MRSHRVGHDCSDFAAAAAVAQCVWLFYNPMDLPGSLSMGILQARLLEWVAMPSFRASSQHRDHTQVSPMAGRLLTEPPGKPKDTEVGSLSLL